MWSDWFDLVSVSLFCPVQVWDDKRSVTRVVQMFEAIFTFFLGLGFLQYLILGNSL